MRHDVFPCIRNAWVVQALVLIKATLAVIRSQVLCCNESVAALALNQYFASFGGIEGTLTIELSVRAQCFDFHLGLAL